jgi:hypothetical protein
MRRLKALRLSIDKKEEQAKPFLFDQTPDVPKRKLEFVVKVNVKHKGPRDILVHEDDEAYDLAADFAEKHHITDKTKQHALLQMLQQKIYEHRHPKIEPEQDSVANI